MSREILITLPKRGLRVVPPRETQVNMQRARNGEIVTWSDEEKARLRLLINCSILSKRHRNPEQGKDYMQQVDMGRRDYLFSLAQELSSGIVDKWKEINPHQDIAVILYGSVAKGLARRADHPDPSNIDMAVIGKISQYEKGSLFDVIRPMRNAAQKRILAECPVIDSKETNPGNAGIMIQDTDVISKDNYSCARAYISGRAVALHDPAGIWAQTENNALAYEINRYNAHQERQRKKVSVRA